MNFSEALTAMKAGSTVRRRCWDRHVLFALNGERGPYLQHGRTDGLLYADPWRPFSHDMWAEDWEMV